jgi:hypothetical protein
MKETNQDSLASYLWLTQKELHSLLLATGLAHLHGKQFRILRSQGNSSYSWQHFLVEQSLEGYFNSMTVNKKRHFWISLGSMKKKLAGSFNPQSTFFKTPLCLPELHHPTIQKSRSMIRAVLHLYNQEMEKNKQPDDVEDNDNFDDSMSRANNGND